MTACRWVSFLAPGAWGKGAERRAPAWALMMGLPISESTHYGKLRFAPGTRRVKAQRIGY